MHVGLRLRERRMTMGATQTDLAEAVGLTYQQIQQDESGSSQIFSSRLYELASVLEVPLSFFFFKGLTPSRRVRGNFVLAEGGRLAHFYHMISDRDVRNAVRAVVLALAEESSA